MTNMIIKLVLISLLVLCGVQDLRKKKISLWIILIGAFLIGVCIPFGNTLSLPSRLGGAAIGAAVGVISIATAGKIGMGDAFVLIVTGLGLGFWSNLELFAIALLLASIISIILLISRLADRKKSIPFVPFLLFGYLFLFLVER